MNNKKLVPSSTRYFALLALLLGSASCLSQLHFPATSASSSSSSNQASDHEESEQVQAFVIAEPQSAASESDESTVSASSSSSSSGNADSISNSIGQVDSGSSSPSGLTSALPILINLALNNMAATMSHGPGGPTFRSSRDPCSGCGCKCGHGSQSVLCQLCAQRGYKSSPCPCAGSSGSSPVAPSAYMTPSASYYYPVYYDAITGLPVSSGSNRMYTGSYYRSPYYGGTGRSMSMAASYVVPTYATAATTVIPVSASAIASPGAAYSPYQTAATYLYPVSATPRSAYGGHMPYAAATQYVVPTYAAAPSSANSFARRSSWSSSPYTPLPLASQFIPVRYYSPYVY